MGVPRGHWGVKRGQDHRSAASPEESWPQWVTERLEQSLDPQLQLSGNLRSKTSGGKSSGVRRIQARGAEGQVRDVAVN